MWVLQFLDKNPDNIGNLYKLFGFFQGNLRPDPPKPRGDFKIPEGTLAGPRAGAEGGERREAPNGARSGGPRARQRALGDFKIPDWAEGDVAKIPAEKTRITCIFF